MSTGGNGNTEDIPFCPGTRFLFFSIPYVTPTFATNVTLKMKDGSELFSKVYFRMGECPNLELNKYDLSLDTTGSGNPGLIYPNILTTGRMYIAMKCSEDMASLSTKYFINLMPTCYIDCFKNGGFCDADAPFPYCKCDRWHEDQQTYSDTSNCKNLYTGVLAWFVVFIIIGIAFLFSVIYIFIQRRRQKVAKEEHERYSRKSDILLDKKFKR